MSNESVQSGRAPTEDQKFYLSWGRESVKHNLKMVNDMLSKMIVLNSAFAGGAVVQKQITNPTAKTWVIVFFLIALIISFIGYMPYESKVDISNPEEIKEHKNKALRHKRNYLWIAAAIMVVGFTSAAFILCVQ